MPYTVYTVLGFQRILHFLILNYSFIVHLIERVVRIELTSSGWKPGTLPLSYTRFY